jgi:hypothetical protein
MTRLRKIRSILAKAVLALALAGLLGGIVAPAHADDRDRRGPPPRHDRRPPPHRFYAPAPVYAPPAVVYAPPAVSPGINLVIPLNIR